MGDILSDTRMSDPVLEGVAVEYPFPDNAGFALYPIVYSNKRGGKIPKGDKSQFALINTVTAPGADAKRIKRAKGSVTYVLLDRKIEEPIPEEESQEAAPAQRSLLEQSAVEKGMFQIGVEVEKEQADLAQAVGTYPTGHTLQLTGGVGKYHWDDYTNSDPIARLEDAIQVVEDEIGKRPNVLLLAGNVWTKLKRHPKVLALIPIADPQTITKEMLAKALEIDKVVIGKSKYSDDGGKTLKNIWSDTAVLAYVPPQPKSYRDFSFGYTLRLKGRPEVKMYWDDRADSDIAKNKDCLGIVQTGTDGGFLIYDILTP